MAHRTFATTSVRSSESGAFWVNQSTSRRITSAISAADASWCCSISFMSRVKLIEQRSEEHTSELQSQSNLVCRLLLEKKKTFTHDEPIAIELVRSAGLCRWMFSL